MYEKDISVRTSIKRRDAHPYGMLLRLEIETIPQKAHAYKEGLDKVQGVSKESERVE